MPDLYDTIKPRELGDFLREANRVRLAQLELESAARQARIAMVTMFTELKED